MFNVDRTGWLFWRRLPARLCLGKDEAVALGHKAVKDRLTLLLGGSAVKLCFSLEIPHANFSLWIRVVATFRCTT
jgi:hypothetical protein